MPAVERQRFARAERPFEGALGFMAQFACAILGKGNMTIEAGEGQIWIKKRSFRMRCRRERLESKSRNAEMLKR